MAQPKSASVEVWHKPGGGMMQRCDCLPIEHPMHPYNQLKNKGLVPEDYGVEHPHVAEFKSKSRSELVAEIIQLRGEIMCRESNMF